MIETAEPIEVASVEISAENIVPALIMVFLYVIFSSQYSDSPSVNGLNWLLLSESIYFTKIVGYSISILFGRLTYWIIALIPDDCPVTFFPTNSERYKLISTPKFRGFNFTAKKLLSKVTFPGIITDPSLKILLPKLSIWFCKIDCKVFNSLVCTGLPGLKRTL